MGCFSYCLLYCFFARLLPICRAHSVQSAAWFPIICRAPRFILARSPGLPGGAGLGGGRHRSLYCASGNFHTESNRFAALVDGRLEGAAKKLGRPTAHCAARDSPAVRLLPFHSARLTITGCDLSYRSSLVLAWCYASSLDTVRPSAWSCCIAMLSILSPSSVQS